MDTVGMVSETEHDDPCRMCGRADHDESAHGALLPYMRALIAHMRTDAYRLPDNPFHTTRSGIVRTTADADDARGLRAIVAWRNPLLHAAGVELYDDQWRRIYPTVGQSAQPVGQSAVPVGQWAPLVDLTDAERRVADAGLDDARDRARAGWPAPQGIPDRSALTCDDAAPLRASDLRLCVRVPQASDLRLCRNKPLTCDDAGRGGTDSSSLGTPTVDVFTGAGGSGPLTCDDAAAASGQRHNRRSQPCAEGHAEGTPAPSATAPATAPAHGPDSAHRRRSGGHR